MYHFPVVIKFNSIRGMKGIFKTMRSSYPHDAYSLATAPHYGAIQYVA